MIEFYNRTVAFACKCGKTITLQTHLSVEAKEQARISGWSISGHLHKCPNCKLENTK